nr:hypothetical protein C4D60_Mb03t03480 [Ipomoea batatas]
MSSLVETGKSITDTKFGWTLEVMIVLKQFQNIFSSESDSATKMSSTAAGVRRRGLAAEQGSRQQRQARQEVEDDCYRRPATRISGGAGHPAAGKSSGKVANPKADSSPRQSRQRHRAVLGFSPLGFTHAALPPLRTSRTSQLSRKSPTLKSDLSSSPTGWCWKDCCISVSYPHNSALDSSSRVCSTKDAYALIIDSGPLTVEGAIVIRGGSQPLVEHNSDVHFRKDIRMCKALSAVVATDFLIGDEGEVDGADRLESRSLEAANRFQVLEADAFHVLGAPGVDVTSGAIDLGAKRRVRPLVRLGRDDVGVGIEEDSGEGGVLARPLEDNHRLPLHEFYNLSFQG